MANKYSVRKTVFGRFLVSFECPNCHEKLRSPLADAGSEDYCPDCKAKFIVPGAKELNKLKAIKAAREESERSLQQRRITERREEIRKEQEIRLEEAIAKQEEVKAQEEDTEDKTQEDTCKLAEKPSDNALAGIGCLILTLMFSSCFFVCITGPELMPGRFQQVGYWKSGRARVYTFYTTSTDSSDIERHARRRLYSQGGSTTIYYFDDREEVPNVTTWADPYLDIDRYPSMIAVYQNLVGSAYFERIQR